MVYGAMLAKVCCRSQGQPPWGLRRRAMMASRWSMEWVMTIGYLLAAAGERPLEKPSLLVWLLRLEDCDPEAVIPAQAGTQGHGCLLTKAILALSVIRRAFRLMCDPRVH